jgi:hypothetical protein
MRRIDLVDAKNGTPRHDHVNPTTRRAGHSGGVTPGRAVAVACFLAARHYLRGLQEFTPLHGLCVLFPSQVLWRRGGQEHGLRVSMRNKHFPGPGFRAGFDRPESGKPKTECSVRGGTVGGGRIAV